MSTKSSPKIQLTDRFFTAVTYATTMHRDQVRKSTDIPYICHPLGVAASLIEAGADEDQVIGGLLHDVAEDCGGEPRLVDIKQMFGERVEAIVRGCSDSLTQSEDDKEDWGSRKQKHLDHLKNASNDVLIVTAADKLNNARAIATDFQIHKSEVWKRFNSKTNQTLITKYYRDILKILTSNGISDVLLLPLKEAIDAFADKEDGTREHS